MRKDNPNIPTYKELIVPTFTALKELGGSGTNNEIYEKVIVNMKFSNEILDFPHLGSATLTELQYQLAWARTYLKNYGIIKNSGRSLWSLSSKFALIDSSKLNPTEIISYSHKHSKMDFSNTDVLYDSGVTHYMEGYPDENKPWRSILSDILQNMDPYAFERLCQRVLRECGFEDVKVTKKSGDGGIDGTGKLLIGGLISFSIAFQCKRYKNSVSSSEIRNFRGSMSSNVEKGIFITTGIYTEDAKKEAVALGKKQIDLVDGEKFMDILLDKGLGIKEVKYYKVETEFFDTI